MNPFTLWLLLIMKITSSSGLANTFNMTGVKIKPSPIQGKHQL